MSTKKIRELIEDAGNWDDSRRYELTQAALAEVEAIEKACRLLYQQGVVHNEFGEQHETTPQLDAAADHLMKIGEESK